MEVLTMKTYNEILKDIEKARAALKDTAASEKNLSRLFLLETRKNGSDAEFEKARAQYEAAEEQYKKEVEHNGNIKLKIEILKNNAQQALFNEIITPICDIWNKYEGKPHGEKTAAKIREELKAATGFYVSIGNKYDDARIFITPPYGTPAPFNNLEFYPIWNGEKQPALIENKIVKLAADNMKVYCCGEYVENVNAHIKALRKAHAEAMQAEKAMQEAVEKYNKLTRGNIAHANTREGVKHYLI
jgi:hypothetical protein